MMHKSPSSPSVNSCWQKSHGLAKLTVAKTTSKDDSDLRPDDIIVDPKTNSSFKRGRLIGKGGFAKVYEVTELNGQSRCYADKIIDKEVFSRRSTSKDKVKREIVLHKDLIHSNVVRFHNFFNDADNNVHILLEYCSQKSLLHVMKNRKVLTEPEVRYYLVQICEGVRYLHKKTILHRDLKLGNMFLTWDMTVKIGDFGLATQHPQQQLNSGGSAPTTLCGTPNYIAPEVLRKQGHGYEADIWALGCMMYAMLVGTPPFETKSLGRTYARIAANEYEMPERLSPAAQCFISKLLHPDPKCRGHLHQSPSHPHDLLTHSFFHSGLCPQRLPQTAASHAPKLPLDNLFNSNNNSSQTEVLMNKKDSTSPFGSCSYLIDCSDSSSSSTTSSSSSTGATGSNSSSNRLRHTIRQKLSQMFTGGHHQARHRSGAVKDQLVFQIIDVLENWMSRRPVSLDDDELANHPGGPISVVPLFVSKWIDYSNKYGFGYQLSDRSVGVLFNEGTRLCQSADGDCLEFTDLKGKSVAWRGQATPPFVDLTGRLKLLDYFARYMDENLAEGVVSTLCVNQMLVTTRQRSVVPQVVRWTRTASAVIMELNNGSVQVNFIRDHAKIIFWGGESHSLATYMETDKAPLTFNLRTLPRRAISGTTTSASMQMYYAMDNKISQSLEVLRDLAEKLYTHNAIEH